MRSKNTIAGIAVAVWLTSFALAQEVEQPSAHDWLESHGVSFGALVFADAVGARTSDDTLGSNGLGFVEVSGSVDTHKAGLWQGGTFAATLHANIGRPPSSYVGDYQVTSNIEAPEELRLYEASYGHTFRDDSVELLFGVQDLNTSFNYLDNAAVFINSSFGITPELAQVNPSIYPRTGLGVFARFRFADHGYLFAGAYKAAPGDRVVEQFRVRGEDGLLLIAEAGVFRPQSELTVGAGIWHEDRDFVDFASTNRNNNSGFYVIAERAFQTRRGFEVLPFVQLGQARRDRNQVASYYGAGVQFAGLLRKRPDDLIGVAVADAVNGDRFLDANPDRVRRETAIELTYLAELAPWIAIQPDVQVVLNPGMERAAANVWVGTLRFIFRPLASMR